MTTFSGKFKSRAELGGGTDPRINANGRPDRLPDRPLTNRELREKEMMLLLRKIKPHVSDAIMQAAKIMKSDISADTNKLKAATLLLQQYRELVKERYSEAYDMDVSEEIQQQNSPVFSLRLLEGEG